MDILTAIQERIRSLCKGYEIGINELAEVSALSLADIQSILDGESQDLEIEDLKRICDGLDITLGEFFSTPEFDTLEQEIQ